MLDLIKRPRRLRASTALRSLVRETSLSANDLILPLFVSEKVNQRSSVPSMPGVFQLTIDDLVTDAVAAHGKGIPAVLLFGIPREKDEQATQAYDDDGIVQRAVRVLKRECPELVVITDVCLCEFMSHG